MTTTATRPTPVTAKAVKKPTPYQRRKMFEALTAEHFCLPRGVNGRSLEVMFNEGWITEHAADGRLAGPTCRARYGGFTHFRLTLKGRMALLTPSKLLVMESADEHGRITLTALWLTLGALEVDGLVAHFTDHGQQVKGTGTPYITNLGRHLMGGHPVDETPAADSLIAALAEWGIPAAVEAQENGNTAVVYKVGSVRGDFYRVLPGNRRSVTHPAWMHNSAWYGFVDNGGNYGELHVPEGIGLAKESAFVAEAFAEYLTGPTA
ncbi:hypothetical protein [Streptomyces sp. NPDC058751]|uniref:hypothetical protein n=1 Tax=Streptomyces sp. NPDC058751 TaxID=3346623 RepID=UPI0036B0E981